MPTRTFRTVVDFSARFVDSTFIDLIADSVSSVLINGESLSPAEVFDGARVTFPSAPPQFLTIEAQARYSTSGEGLHRFTDPPMARPTLYAVRTDRRPTRVREFRPARPQPSSSSRSRRPRISRSCRTAPGGTEPADGSAGAVTHYRTDARQSATSPYHRGPLQGDG